MYMLNKVNLILIQRGSEIMRCYEPKVQFVCCTCLLRSPKTVTVERREDSAHAEPLVFVAWTTYIWIKLVIYYCHECMFMSCCLYN